ncbi:O-succinylbenzoic acid--CoA ligase, partial [bacterium]|nr:O-succinylbenzoic acid--CoA ligase [bacterium]
NLQAGQTALLCLPARYIAGKMMILRALLHDMNLIMGEPSSNPMKTHRREIDFAAMVPLQVIQMIKEGLHSGFLKTVIIGGGKVNTELEGLLSQQSFQAWETFGMTETISHIALRKINGPDATDWFKVLPDITISQDDRQCLVINAPGLCDAPVQTNDIIERCSGTEFTWRGRHDNVIISGGSKYHPEMIEKKIENTLSCRFVISSIAHTDLGEKIVLVVEGPSLPPSETLASIQALLSPHEQPSQVFTLPVFPETNTGKIRRDQVRISLAAVSS